MPNYAQIDQNRRVYGVSCLYEKMEQSDLIEITVYDPNLIGSYHNSVTGDFEQITVSVDKMTIKADGADSATVTATLPTILSSVDFYDGSGNLLKTVQASPDHTAQLLVTATTPGTIRIRAGEPTMTRLNEIEVTAQ